MGIFKRSDSVDVLDLTKLQKKGLLKIPEKEVEPDVKVNSQGYVDLGISVMPSSVDSSPATESSPATSSDSGGGMFGFLDSVASSSSASSSEQQSYFGSSSSGNSDLEISGLKNKIEDLEYKLRVLEDKIAKLGG